MDEVMRYLMDPVRMVILIMNVVGWLLAYRYFRKTLKEWKKMPKKIGKEVVPRDVSKRVVIIGPPKAGKTTIARAIGHALIRRSFVCRTAVGIPLHKTDGIRYYVFDRVRKGGKISMLTDTVVIADFAGEIRATLNEEKGTVEFNPAQVEEIKKADVIIEVIYWKDDVNELRKIISEYDTAIGKALGILGKRNYFESNKILYRVVTHIDESKKIRTNKEIKTMIQRHTVMPSTVFQQHKIIPSNPKQFIESYEGDYNMDPEQLEKNHGIDILVSALASKEKRKEVRKNEV